MKETFSPLAELRARPMDGSSLDSFVPRLLTTGLATPSLSVKQGQVEIPDGINWVQMCALAHRCCIAPVIYRCLRAVSTPAPPDIIDWFRAQYYESVARNLALVNDLRELLSWLSDASLPAIAVKGPALAHVGLGMARVFRDLDLLVRDENLRRVEALVFRHGYALLPEPPHDYHRRYQRMTAAGPRTLEIHIDIFDRARLHRPDIEGIWARSIVADIGDFDARVPELTDHLLLTIMQLPHHHWSMRLVVDIWHIMQRWGREIDWDELLQRAKRWQMWALARFTLRAIGDMFELPIAENILSACRPVGYWERVQWQVVRQAIVEHLREPFRPRIIWAAPFLLVDHAGLVPSLVMKRSVGDASTPDEGAMATAIRRNLVSLSVVPAMCKLLLSSIREPSSTFVESS